MLPHPQTGEPLIEKALRCAHQNQWPLVLITRPEKKNLIDYVIKRQKNLGFECHWVLVNTTREWPESILAAQNFWGDSNLLILPDTDWNPHAVEVQVLAGLKDADVSYGLFHVEDSSTWGTVKIEPRQISVWEKPLKAEPGYRAWGLLAFRRSVGRPIFNALLESTLTREPRQIPLKSSWTDLSSFEDLTRKILPKNPSVIIDQ